MLPHLIKKSWRKFFEEKFLCNNLTSKNKFHFPTTNNISHDHSIPKEVVINEKQNIEDDLVYLSLFIQQTKKNSYVMRQS